MRVAALLALWVLVWPSTARAGRIRVLAATQVQLDPRDRSDASEPLTIDVRVRDDQPRPVRGTVHLRWTTASRFNGREPDTTTEANADGQATFTVHLAPGDELLRVQASFEGTESLAPSQTPETVIDLDAPFVRLDQPDVAPVVDLPARSGAARTFAVGAGIHVITHLANVANYDLSLYVDDREVAHARPDADGHAAFSVPFERVPQPGFHTLRVESARGDNRVESPTRRFVVRARTTLAIERSTLEAGPGITLGGALIGAGPVGPGAAVRIVQGAQVLGAGLTDEQGVFRITLDPEVAARPDLVVQASFVPTEPWFTPATSEPLRLTARAPARVPWTLVAVPLALAAALLLAMRLRRRAGTTPPPVAMKPLEDGATVERISVAPSAVVRLKLRAVDRSTDASIASATARWIQPPRGELATGQAVEVDGGGRFEVEVRAPGYAPRVLAGELPRGGEYGVRVALRTWREELFERARRWMRQSGAQSVPVLPTLREVLAARGASGRGARFVELVELGTYGPQPPDASHVDAADSLVAEAPSAPPPRG